MHILVLGANGRTGRLVVAEALAHQHTVTALVRDPSTLNPQAGLEIRKGSVLSEEDISAALDSSPSPSAKDNGVIVALSNKRVTDNPFAKHVGPPNLLADSLAAVSAAMRSRGLKRIAVLSAFGVADSSPNLNFLLRAVLRKTNAATQFDDHDAADAQMKKRKDLDWVMVRPVVLSDGEAAPIKDFGDGGQGVSAFAKISRRSVARVLLEAVETDKYVRRTPVVAS